MVVFLVKYLFLIKSCTRSNINLTADNRLDSLPFTLLIKINRTVHISVVGYCK